MCKKKKWQWLLFRDKEKVELHRPIEADNNIQGKYNQKTNQNKTPPHPKIQGTKTQDLYRVKSVDFSRELG